jgi:hypothetical protein
MARINSSNCDIGATHFAAESICFSALFVANSDNAPPSLFSRVNSFESDSCGVTNASRDPLSYFGWRNCLTALSIKTAICEQVAAAHAMHHDHLEGGRFTADEISVEVARTDERGRLAAGDVGGYGAYAVITV